MYNNFIINDNVYEKIVKRSFKEFFLLKPIFRFKKKIFFPVIEDDQIIKMQGKFIVNRKTYEKIKDAINTDKFIML